MMILRTTVFLAILAAAVPALAQTNPFGRSLGATFTREDRNMLETAANKLRADDAKIGDEADWENPQTGNRGRIKLIDTPTIDGLPCRKLVNQVRMKGQSDAQYVSVITCRTALGEWKSAF